MAAARGLETGGAVAARQPLDVASGPDATQLHHKHRAALHVCVRPARQRHGPHGAPRRTRAGAHARVARHDAPVLPRPAGRGRGCGRQLWVVYALLDRAWVRRVGGGARAHMARDSAARRGAQPGLFAAPEDRAERRLPRARQLHTARAQARRRRAHVPRHDLHAGIGWNDQGVQGRRDVPARRAVGATRRRSALRCVPTQGGRRGIRASGAAHGAKPVCQAARVRTAA